VVRVPIVGAMLRPDASRGQGGGSLRALPLTAASRASSTDGRFSSRAQIPRRSCLPSARGVEDRVQRRRQSNRTHPTRIATHQMRAVQRLPVESSIASSRIPGAISRDRSVYSMNVRLVILSAGEFGESVGEVLGFLVGDAAVAIHTAAWGDSRLMAFRRRPCRSSTRRPAYREYARSSEPPRQRDAALDPPPPRTTAVVVSSEPSWTLLHQRRAKPGIVVDRPGIRQRSVYRLEGECRVHARLRACLS
jgi:hypothetical protein